MSDHMQSCAICAEPVYTNDADVCVWIRLAGGTVAPAHRSHLSEPGGEDIELEEPETVR